MTLEWLLNVEAAGLSSSTVSCLSNLAKITPWLLLRDDREPGQPETAWGIRRRVQHRFQQAECGS